MIELSRAITCRTVAGFDLKGLLSKKKKPFILSLSIEIYSFLDRHLRIKNTVERVPEKSWIELSMKEKASICLVSFLKNSVM